MTVRQMEMLLELLSHFGHRCNRNVIMLLKSPEIGLVWFWQELEHAAEQADSVDLVDVWERYCGIYI